MIGKVDEQGRALLPSLIQSSPNSDSIELLTWIDTAFNGELVLPVEKIHQAQLQQSAAMEARRADGSKVILKSYSCFMEWFGQMRQIEVIANEGEYPLLGVQLLLGHVLHVDYQALHITLN